MNGAPFLTRSFRRHSRLRAFDVYESPSSNGGKHNAREIHSSERVEEKRDGSGAADVGFERGRIRTRRERRGAGNSNADVTRGAKTKVAL